jgi:hypothetical protein
MTNIATDDQRFIEEQVLRFMRTDFVPLPIFVRIIVIPLESNTTIKRIDIPSKP